MLHADTQEALTTAQQELAESTRLLQQTEQQCQSYLSENAALVARLAEAQESLNDYCQEGEQ